MSIALDIQELTIRHGTGFELRVPSLQLQAGDCLCFAGDSGCGKSSLLDVLALMAPPAHIEQYSLAVSPGAESLDVTSHLTEASIHDYAVLRSSIIGYAPQSGGMLPFLSAWADSGSSAELSSKDPASWDARRKGHARRLHIDKDLDKNRSALSGGQRKRVSLLRALALPRVLLVLDEPTAGLDTTLGFEAMRLIFETTKADGSACVIASHDVDLARKIGFSIVPIAHERIDGVQHAYLGEVR